MYKTLLLKFALVFLILTATSCSPKIVNLSVAKAEVQNYYESGGFYNELNSIIDKAINEVNALSLPDKAAVVFDVDDTALSGYDYTKQLGFGYTWQSWNKWVLETKAKPIIPVKRFYDFLISRNIKVLFLTGRTLEQCNATKQNLLKAGYTKFDTLVCSSNSKKIPVSVFKENERKKFTDMGYNIIASIGDQNSDLEGKFTGMKIKIPNYLYILKD